MSLVVAEVVPGDETLEKVRLVPPLGATVWLLPLGVLVWEMLAAKPLSCAVEVCWYAPMVVGKSCA